MKSDKCGPKNLSDIHESKFSVKHLFLIFHYPTHSVCTFCLPRNLLFVYLQHPKYRFCLSSYSIIILLYYLCIVLKVLFVYLLKNTSYLQPRITCLLFLRPTSTSFCLPTLKYFLFTSADYKLPFVMDDFDIIAFPTHLQRLHLPYTSFINHHGENQSNEPPQ